jgi:NADH:ubiquinone oxidoreductase subunit 6 (subunit J)
MPGDSVAVSVTALFAVGDAEFVSVVVVAVYGAIAVETADGVSFVIDGRSLTTRK